MVKKRGLGKSLDALLAYSHADNVTPLEELQATPPETLTQLAIDVIQPGKYQPRREIATDSLEELASSIRAHGILQPLLVRSVGNNRYELIAGERRWRAALVAELKQVPVIIREIPDEAAIAIALIENIQRENLNPIEESIAFNRLLKEFGMTHQQVAEAVGKSRAHISNLLRLLSLVPEVKDLLERGQLEMGHARTLITLPEAVQLEAAQIIVARGLSVRETEHLVRRLQAPVSIDSKKPLTPDLIHLQESLARQLKLKVAIQCNAKGRGKLVIHYRNLNELNHLLANLQNT